MKYVAHYAGARSGSHVLSSNKGTRNDAAIERSIFGRKNQTPLNE